jgi:hypothetical protein
MATNKTQLMARAWAMHRETRKSMSACMRRAWELVRLADDLHRPGVVHITYRKKDGSIRKALATLNVGPGAFVNSAFRRAESPKVFTYWDLERCEFRSFRCENLMGWYR